MPGEPLRGRETSAWHPPGPTSRRFRFGHTAIPDPDPPLSPGATIGAQEQYRIEEFLGQGGMGRVYGAVRLRDGRELALKVLRQDKIPPDVAGEYHARFKQESEAASRIGHPGIIEMYGFERTPAGEVLLSMERLRGQSLEHWLDAPGRLSVGLNLLAGFADALDAAHRSQIVHRDIKPANLFIQHRDDGSIQPKILDFGLAKMSRSNSTQIETAAGTVLGTPYYLAPERALGKKLTPAADLYSLGVILYEVLTGHLPFDADNFMDVLALHMRKAPLDPRQAVPDRVVPDGVAQLTMDLLAKEPAKRPESAATVAARIRQLLQTEAEVIGAYTTGPRAKANSSAVTMHVTPEGPRAPTVAPNMGRADAMTADAATVAPNADVQPLALSDAATVAPQAERGPSSPALDANALSQAATVRPDASSPELLADGSPTGGTVPGGPMMAFSSGRVHKTRIETTYGKDAAAAKRRRGMAPIWWIPLGAGVGIAGVLAWTIVTPPSPDAAAVAAEPPEQPEAAAKPETPNRDRPAPPAEPQANAAKDPEPARDPQPEPAEAEAEADEVEEPQADHTSPRPKPKKKGKKSAQKKDAEPEPAAPPPPPSPPAEPIPKPDKKPVTRDPDAWKVDG